MSVSQKEFTTAMLDPRQPVPTGLVDPNGHSAGKRFDVYRNNVAVSLTEALITAFPSVYRHLGDHFFRALSAVYLRQHPPSTPLMMFYGEKMPEFLASFEPVAELAYLPDLAKIDLARRQSYHAADSAPISPSALEQVSPDRLMLARLQIAPATFTIKSRWSAFSTWQQVMEGNQPEPDTGPEDVMIARPEFDPVLILLPPSGSTFIEALRSGATFGDAFEAANAKSEGFDLSSTLGAMLSGGSITKLTEGET